MTWNSFKCHILICPIWKRSTEHEEVGLGACRRKFVNSQARGNSTEEHERQKEEGRRGFVYKSGTLTSTWCWFCPRQCTRPSVDVWEWKVSYSQKVKRILFIPLKDDTIINISVLDGRYIDISQKKHLIAHILANLVLEWKLFVFKQRLGTSWSCHKILRCNQYEKLKFYELQGAAEENLLNVTRFETSQMRDEYVILLLFNRLLQKPINKT